jgi:beta-lactamase regulating signal transducer with metallopeptidase domain
VDLLHVTARLSVEWMLYCLLEGTVLALFAWLLLRLLPRQNAGTRFALWFSVLLAMIVLPFLAGTFLRTPGTGAAPAGIPASHSLMTLPDSVAVGIFAVWALIAALALMRVIVGLWQVNRIFENSDEVDPASLSSAVRTSLETFPRIVTLRVSDCVQVPAAIGFFKPAVVIPRWFLQEISSRELEQVLLHELTHLRRRDDWTNLAQKIIKALLFFHPSVWWVEQRLSLEREMACDDAVLAQSASPHHYAQCLTRLAEKSLTRKRIALAQAVVSRMCQLSLRVAQILDVNRPSTTRLWKPAVPMVLAAAALCGLSAWSAPALVSFHDDSSAPAINQSQSAAALSREVPAGQPKLVLASASVNPEPTQPKAGDSKSVKSNSRFHATLAMNRARLRTETRYLHPRQAGISDMPGEPAMSRQAQPNGDYVVQSEQVIVTMTGGSGTGNAQTWQVQMWQVRILVPAGDHAGKTVSRKNI